MPELDEYCSRELYQRYQPALAEVVKAVRALTTKDVKQYL